jgi:hypothetical protein
VGGIDLARQAQKDCFDFQGKARQYKKGAVSLEDKAASIQETGVDFVLTIPYCSQGCRLGANAMSTSHNAALTINNENSL